MLIRLSPPILFDISYAKAIADEVSDGAAIFV